MNWRPWRGSIRQSLRRPETLYMDVDLDRGAGYGDTLTWTEQNKPHVGVRAMEVQDDLNLDKFYKMFVDLLSARTTK